MFSFLDDLSYSIFRAYRDIRERSHPTYKKIVPWLLQEAFSENTPKTYIKQGEVHDWLKSLLKEDNYE
jgi:hypothetical protein